MLTGVYAETARKCNMPERIEKGLSKKKRYPLYSLLPVFSAHGEKRKCGRLWPHF
ncbi:hypothetical protein EPYR_02099 [Erwinia pyrifoliae DSM 12163]|nr:hypothetical protein EPYR_02099 [Erwinia pyrifoliae DSM 12163]